MRVIALKCTCSEEALMLASGLTTHKDLVEWLKREHGLGHGHATAITEHLLAERTPGAKRSGSG